MYSSKGGLGFKNGHKHPKSGNFYLVENLKSDSGRTHGRKAVREGGPRDCDRGQWSGIGEGVEGSLFPNCKANSCHFINPEPKQIWEGLSSEHTECKHELTL